MHQKGAMEKCVALLEYLILSSVTETNGSKSICVRTIVLWIILDTNTASFSAENLTNIFPKKV